MFESTIVKEFYSADTYLKGYVGRKMATFNSWLYVQIRDGKLVIIGCASSAHLWWLGRTRIRYIQRRIRLLSDK